MKQTKDLTYLLISRLRIRSPDFTRNPRVWRIHRNGVAVAPERWWRFSDGDADPERRGRSGDCAEFRPRLRAPAPEQDREAGYRKGCPPVSGSGT